MLQTATSFQDLPPELLQRIVGSVAQPDSVGAFARSCRAGRDAVAKHYQEEFDVVHFNLDVSSVTFITTGGIVTFCSFSIDDLSAEFVRFYARRCKNTIAVTVGGENARFPWEALRGRLLVLTIFGEHVQEGAAIPRWAEGMQGAGFDLLTLIASIDALCTVSSLGYHPCSWTATTQSFRRIPHLLDSLEKATSKVVDMVLDEPEDLYAFYRLGNVQRLRAVVIRSPILHTPRMFLPRLNHLAISVHADEFERSTHIEDHLAEIGSGELKSVHATVFVNGWWRDDPLTIDMNEVVRQHRGIEALRIDMYVDRHKVPAVVLIGESARWKNVRIRGYYDGLNPIPISHRWIELHAGLPA